MYVGLTILLLFDSSFIILNHIEHHLNGYHIYGYHGIYQLHRYHSFSFYANLYLLFHFWANVFCSFYPLLSSTASSLFSIALFVLSPQFSYDMIFTSTFVNLLSHYKNVVIEHHSKLFGSRWNGSPRVARSRQIYLFLYIVLAIVTRFTCLKPIVVMTVTSGGSSARYISFYLTYFFAFFSFVLFVGFVLFANQAKFKNRQNCICILSFHRWVYICL